MKSEKLLKKLKRKKRVRAKVLGTTDRPRLSVFRSIKHIYAQIINDEKGQTMVAASDLELLNKKSVTTDYADSKKITQKKSMKSKNISDESVVLKKYAKTDIATMVGELLAKKTLKKKIKRVVFDRGGYKYHGRIKALAEGARKGGLIF